MVEMLWGTLDNLLLMIIEASHLEMAKHKKLLAEEEKEDPLYSKSNSAIFKLKGHHFLP